MSGPAEMLLGDLAKRWASELRRHPDCLGRVGTLLDRLGWFKLSPRRGTKLVPFVRVREPGGIVIVLASEFMMAVAQSAAEHDVDPRQLLVDSIHYRILISAEDVGRFCQEHDFPPPSFWPATHEHAERPTARLVAEAAKRLDAIVAASWPAGTLEESIKQLEALEAAAAAETAAAASQTQPEPTPATEPEPATKTATETKTETEAVPAEDTSGPGRPSEKDRVRAIYDALPPATVAGVTKLGAMARIVQKKGAPELHHRTIEGHLRGYFKPVSGAPAGSRS